MEGLEALLLQQSELLGREMLRSGRLSAELAAARRRLEAVEPALERQLVERQVATRQVLLLQRHVAERYALHEGAQVAQLRLAEGQLASLSSRLEEAQALAARLERRASESDAEADAVRRQLQQLQQLQQSQASGEAAGPYAALPLAAVEEGVADGFSEAEERVVSSRVEVSKHAKQLKGGC